MGVLLALVPSDKVVFVTYMYFKIGFFRFRQQSFKIIFIHPTFRRNMTVYHILEFVNNFMQIFEPAHFVN